MYSGFICDPPRLQTGDFSLAKPSQANRHNELKSGVAEGGPGKCIELFSHYPSHFSFGRRNSISSTQSQPAVSQRWEKTKDTQKKSKTRRFFLFLFVYVDGKKAIFGMKSPFYPTCTIPRGEMMHPVGSPTHLGNGDTLGLERFSLELITNG